MTTGDTLVIFTRFPEPGRVKTRMIPALGEQGASDLLAAMTRHVLSVAGRLAETDGTAVEVHFDGGRTEAMQAMYGNGRHYVRQQGADLGERMLSSFTCCLGGEGRAVLIGTDCPGITETLLRRAFALLKENDLVLGPSEDGGYYLMGLNRPVPGLFSGIPWGTDRVFDLTMQAGKRLGLRTGVLDRLPDIDRPGDIRFWEEKVRAASQEMISVIIPALNEQGHIEQSLERVLSGENIELIVVDGGSTDGTGRAAALKGARVVLSRPGRSRQMNAGAARALGAILFFLHADSLVPTGYDAEIRKLLGQSGSIAGAFSLDFDGGSLPMRIIAAGANARCRCLREPWGDQGLFLTKQAFLDAGGFPETPIMEDVLLARKLKSLGRIAISRSRIKTSFRRYREIGPLKAWMINRFAMAALGSGIPLEKISALYRRRETSIRRWISLWEKKTLTGRT
jgi:rSAM/selenodomain-associated transferase 2/rSAM/selenodomain-associated transferase 1